MGDRAVLPWGLEHGGDARRIQKDPRSLCLQNVDDAMAEVRASLFRRLIYGLAMMMFERAQIFRSVCQTRE